MKLLTDGSQQQGDTQPWERQPGEGEKAHQAFEMYRLLSTERSLRVVADQLGKSRTLIERWSKRYMWKSRVLAYDNYVARTINADVLQNLAHQAKQFQRRASERLDQMTAEEVASLTPYEAALFAKTAFDISTKTLHMNGEGIGIEMPQPQFTVQIISPGKDMVAVQLADGRYGYIPKDQVERFRRDHPEAVVVA